MAPAPIANVIAVCRSWCVDSRPIPARAAIIRNCRDQPEYVHRLPRDVGNNGSSAALPSVAAAIRAARSAVIGDQRERPDFGDPNT